MSLYAVVPMLLAVARRLSEWTVVCAALVIAGVAYSMFWTMSGLLLSGGWLANRKR